MDLIFSYGSLQDKGVQQILFNKQLVGEPDTLIGFELITKKAYGNYPIIAKTNSFTAKIDGIVFGISGKELQIVDNYEGIEYSRIAVKLKSGKEAWVYIAKLP